MNHKGELQKGYIHYYPEFGFQFSVRRNARDRKIYFTVPLPSFKQNWIPLIGNDILFTVHSTVRSLLKIATASTNDPSLNYVSAKHLLSSCPLSLFKALDHSNRDRQVWLDSYNEEEQGLFDHEVNDNIQKIQYLALKLSGKIPKYIPSM